MAQGGGAFHRLQGLGGDEMAAFAQARLVGEAFIDHRAVLLGRQLGGDAFVHVDQAEVLHGRLLRLSAECRYL
ncbi:hypothetical protein D3C80_2143130 [compost metagenome]